MGLLFSCNFGLRFSSCIISSCDIKLCDSFSFSSCLFVLVGFSSKKGELAENVVINIEASILRGDLKHLDIPRFMC